MLTKERDEELALFLEMRRCEMEREKNNLLSFHNSSELDTAPASNGGVSPITKIVSSVPQRKTAVDNFFNSENEKTDFDWLLTPPGTPLFPHLEKDSQKTIMTDIGNAKSCPNALRSRFENIPADPAPGSSVAANPTIMSFGLNSSNAGNRRPSSSGARSDVAAKPATMPFGLNFSNTCNRRPSPSATRSSSPAGRQSLPTSAKTSRASTPTSRASLTSMKPTTLPVRSSTPSKTTTRSSTPTTRISVTALKTASRSATPTQRPSAPSSAPTVAAPGGPTSSKNPVPSRGTSPNLRASLPERPASASKGRPGAPSGQLPSVAISSNGRPRLQSCSPTRGRASYGSVHCVQKNTTAKNRVRTKNNDDVNPVLIGTKMVKRVVNMRKLAPPKQDDTRSAHTNLSGKSFGRTLSKKSLDMALRHMDIRRNISGNLRPVVTNIPASSVYSMRSGGSWSGSTSDSPRSNASSFEFRVNSNSNFYDGNEMENNGFGSNGVNSSPSSGLHDR